MQALFIELDGIATTLVAMKRMDGLLAVFPEGDVQSMVWTHGCQALSKLAFNIMTQVCRAQLCRSCPTVSFARYFFMHQHMNLLRLVDAGDHDRDPGLAHSTLNFCIRHSLLCRSTC
jgi:hypothetical protein